MRNGEAGAGSGWEVTIGSYSSQTAGARRGPAAGRRRRWVVVVVQRGEFAYVDESIDITLVPPADQAERRSAPGR